VLGAAAVGIGVWQLVPAPPADLTAADLAGVYAGMVRSDGQNEVSVIDRSRIESSPLSVSPPRCTALFEQTTGNTFSPTALDGVSTYWLNEGSATISLLTYRYADTEAAERAYEPVRDAVPDCRSVKVNGQAVEVSPLPTNRDQEAPPQVAYVTAVTGDSARFATQVFQLSNTITWHYRYDYRSGPYDPTAAQRLTDALVVQMRAVQAMKPK
jgi:hypothetical protein